MLIKSVYESLVNFKVTLNHSTSPDELIQTYFPDWKKK